MHKLIVNNDNNATTDVENSNENEKKNLLKMTIMMLKIW